MTTVKCQSCGSDVEVPKAKVGFPWWAGCLIAVAIVPIFLAIFGILGAIAIPSFVRSKQASISNACVANMKMIEATKEQLILEGKAIEKDAVNEVIGRELLCPSGGTYNYNSQGVEPECSVHGSPSNPEMMGQRY